MALKIWLPLNGDLTNQGLLGDVATNNGAVINNNGKIGKCYEFNNDGNYIAVDPTTVTDLTNECSVCFWFNIVSWNVSYATYFQIGKNGYDWTSYIFGFLRIGGGSSCCFTIGDGSNNSQSYYATSALTTGVWYHVCLVYKPGKCQIYLNGALDHEYTTTYVPDFTKVTRFTIGKANSYSNYQTNCLMNDFRLYDTALSPREVAEIAKGLVCHYPLNGPTSTQFFGDVVEDNRVFSIRPTINNKPGAFDKIVGASTGWNQLWNETKIPSDSVIYNSNTYTNNGVTFTKNNDGSISVSTVSGGATANTSVKIGDNSKIGQLDFIHLILGSTKNVSIQYISHNVIKDGEVRQPYSGGYNMWIYVQSGKVITTPEKIYPQIFNLNQIFSATIVNYARTLDSSTAGSGVAWLRSQGFFTQDYYPYNPGQIKSVEGLVKREVTGRNYWTNDKYNMTTNGGITINTDGSLRIAQVSYQENNNSYIIPEELSSLRWHVHFDYECTSSSNSSARCDVRFFYSDGTATSTTIPCGSVGLKNTITLNSVANKKVQKMAFGGWAYQGVINVSNICLNIYDENFNGQYEPYTSHTYSFTNPPTLRGVYKLDANNNIYADGDTWDSNGSVGRRYGVMVLDGTGSNTFTGSFGSQTSGNFVVYKTMPVNKSVNTICDRFTYTGQGVATMPLYSYVGSSGASATWSFAFPSTITSLSDANAWLVNNPVTIIYPLDTPTTETSTTFTNPQIYEPGGTESYSFTGLIPPGHTTKYVDVSFDGGTRTYEETLTNMGVDDGVVYDVSGYGNNGGKVGTITYSNDTPRYDACSYFDGSSYIYTQPDTFNWFTYDKCTISVWMKPTYKPSGYSGSVGISHDYANNNKAFALTNHAGNFVAYYNNTVYSYVSSGYTLPLNEWHHCAATLDGTTVKVYVDGVLKNTVTIDWSAATSGAGQRIQVGVDYPGTDEKYTGYYSDVRIYTTALSDDDILELYQVGASLANNGVLMAHEFIE